MNKAIIGIIGGLLVITAGWWLTSSPSAETQVSTEATQPVTATPPSSNSGQATPEATEGKVIPREESIKLFTPTETSTVTPTPVPAKTTPTSPTPKPASTPTPVAPAPTPVTPPVTVPVSQTPPPQPAQTTVAISIQGFQFSPVTISVKKGTTVKWTNNDPAPHTATADNGSFASDTLSMGQSYSYTFSTVGEFNYGCAFHPSMRGKVTVTE